MGSRGPFRSLRLVARDLAAGKYSECTVHSALYCRICTNIYSVQCTVYHRNKKHIPIHSFVYSRKSIHMRINIFLFVCSLKLSIIYTYSELTVEC